MLLGGIQIAGGAVTADCTPRSQPQPTGTAVRARVNNRYVTAGSAPLIANSTTAGTAQRFDVVDLGGGNVALRSEGQRAVRVRRERWRRRADRQPGRGRPVGDVRSGSTTPTAA